MRLVLPPPFLQSEKRHDLTETKTSRNKGVGYGVGILSSGNTFQKSIRNGVWDSSVQMLLSPEQVRQIPLNGISGKSGVLSQHCSAVLD